MGSNAARTRTSTSAPGASAYPASVEQLIVALEGLPSVGRRTAERLALHLLSAAPAEAETLASAIRKARSSVRCCSVCVTLAEQDPCAICADERRDRGLILVVEQPRELIALEKTGMHRGVYHVLMGRLSPLDGVGPEHLTVRRLIRRVREPASNAGGAEVREVILGLNPTLEGDGTAMYVAEQLAPLGVKVTRLARGVPAGSHLEFASKAALADAIQGRQSME